MHVGEGPGDGLRGETGIAAPICPSMVTVVTWTSPPRCSSCSAWTYARSAALPRDREV